MNKQMAETDNPLKRLVEVAISDFAAWLLGVEVQDAYAVNIELTSNLVRVDQLFRVTMQNGRTTLLHIEFQGRSTHRPMKWRMLEYMARIADAEPELDLFSVVFYVGVGLALRTQANIRSIHLVIQPASNGNIGSFMFGKCKRQNYSNCSDQGYYHS